GVQPVRGNWIRLTAASRRCGVGGRIPGHVGERHPGVRRKDDAPAVGLAAVLAVLIGAAEIDDVWMALGSDDQIVIPALPSAVVDSLPGRNLRRSEISEDRHASLDKIAAVKMRR